MACSTCGRGGIDVDNCYEKYCPYKRMYPKKRYEEENYSPYEYESQFYGRRSSGCLGVILVFLVGLLFILIN